AERMFRAKAGYKDRATLTRMPAPEFKVRGTGAERGKLTRIPAEFFRRVVRSDRPSFLRSFRQDRASRRIRISDSAFSHRIRVAQATGLFIRSLALPAHVSEWPSRAEGLLLQHRDVPRALLAELQQVIELIPRERRFLAGALHLDEAAVA